MSPEQYVTIVTSLGLPTAAVIVLWRWVAKRTESQEQQSMVREERLSKRLDELETYQRNTLEQVVRENTNVMLRLESYLQKDET